MSSLIVATILQSFNNASFYRLFAVAAITDILLWIVGFVANRARNAPIFFPVYALLPKEGPILTTIVFLLYYLQWVQYGTTLALTLNRFSVIAMPFSYVRLWRKYFRHVIAGIFLYPLPLTYHIIFAGGFLGWNNPDNHDGGYRLDITADGTEKRNSLFMMIGSGKLGLLIVYMNLRIALSLYRRRRANLNGNMDKEDTRDTESKLFLLTCIMFSFTAITFVNQFLFYFLFPDKMSMETFFRLFALRHFAIDLHACSSPWFLLFMSRAVREEVTRIIPFVGKAEPSTIVPASQATSSIQPAPMPL